jgi:hypothetical protein
VSRSRETARIVAAVNDYLARRERGDVECQGLRSADIARVTHIAKRHLSRDDEPELAALKRRLFKLRGTGGQSAAPPGADPAQHSVVAVESTGSEWQGQRQGRMARALSDDELEADLDGLRREVVFRLRQWLAYYESRVPDCESPLMRDDLVRLIDQLRRITPGIDALARECARRERDRGAGSDLADPA